MTFGSLKLFRFLLLQCLYCVCVVGYGIAASEDAAIRVETVEYEEDLLLDKRAPPDESTIYASIARDLPSLPIDFFRRYADDDLRLNASCAPYPLLLQLQFHNVYWQRFSNANVTYFLHSAYYDQRPTVTAPQQPLVRVLAMVDEFASPELPRSYCQLWYAERRTPLIVPVVEHRVIWYREYGTSPDLVYPTLVMCAPPPPDAADLVPQTVSLVAEECARASNNLRVVHDEPAVGESKRGFAVCTTALYFPYTDVSARLVEWLELMRLLGADKVVLPELGLHANVTRLLRHYVRSGFVEVPKTSLARGEPPLPHFNHIAIGMDLSNHRLNEVVHITDCFLRNMYKYEYIAVLDVDEVIMPLGAYTTWADIVRHVRTQELNDACSSYAALCFLNVYFPRYEGRPPHSAAAPHYMYMMQHVARVAEHLSPQLATKCFHNTDHVLGVHNHHPVLYENTCDPITLNETVAQLQHYREPDIPETLENPVLDESIWRYRDALVARSRDVLHELGFLVPARSEIKMTNITQEKSTKVELR